MRISCILGWHEWKIAFKREFCQANYPILETVLKCRHCGKLQPKLTDTLDGTVRYG